MLTATSTGAHAQTTRRSLQKVLLWLTLSILAPYGAADTCFDSSAAHQCTKTENPIDACQEFLNSDPYDLQARFSLCDMHIRSNAALKALIVLDQGLALCGKDRDRCNRLQQSISALEQASNQKPGSAEFRAQQEDNRKICSSRKRQPVHQAIVACEEALIAFPQDPDLHASYGEKLLQGKQPARAVLAFRRALVLRPGDPNFLSWHDAAEDARQTLVDRCLRHTDLEHCNQAIIPGSKDEVRLHRKRSTLYLQQGNRPAALEAMLIVQVIDPNDVQISEQLLQLIPTNAQISDDRLYLPRGRALLETGDVQRAILDLRRASQRAIDRDVALTELRRARAIRQTVVRETCLATGDLAACEDLIIVGEPDEEELRTYVASLRTPKPSPMQTIDPISDTEERTLMLTDAEPSPSAATPSAASISEPEETAKPEPATIAKPKPTVAKAESVQRPQQPSAATYLNLASVDGTTH